MIMKRLSFLNILILQFILEYFNHMIYSCFDFVDNNQMFYQHTYLERSGYVMFVRFLVLHTNQIFFLYHVKIGNKLDYIVIQKILPNPFLVFTFHWKGHEKPFNMILPDTFSLII
jgi:hypothetical protein